MSFSKRKSKIHLLKTINILLRKKFAPFLLVGILFSCSGFIVSSVFKSQSLHTDESILGIQISAKEAHAEEILLSPVVTVEIEVPTLTPSVEPTATPVPTLQPKPTTTKTITPTPEISPTPTPTVVANKDVEQINDVTWRVSNVEHDDNMATARQIYDSLNSYRDSRGKSKLEWSDTLSELANDRAILFAKDGELDTHAGFKSFMKNGGFDKTGFNSLGENSAFLSGNMSGDNIVRKIFGADSSHDGNQLDNWTHVAVGIKGTAVNVNFGKNKK